MPQEDQEERQCGQALLAIDDELLAVLITDDDRAEKVVAVCGDRIPFMVVVEAGRAHSNQTVPVGVTSVLQTSAGRMVFGRIENSR